MKNNFDFTPEDPTAKNTKCPFASHIRKMRPRADLYVQKGDESEEIHASNFVNNSNVILRRSITWGPEAEPSEIERGVTEEGRKRGIYFLCYQGSIRAGFNFMVTRKSFHLPYPDLPNCDTNTMLCVQAGQATKSSPSTRWWATALVSMVSSARETVQTIRRVGSAFSRSQTKKTPTTCSSVRSTGSIRGVVSTSSRRPSTH